MRNAIFSICAAIALLTGIDARAGAPRLRYGLEWGNASAFYQSSHLNYITYEGYRVDDNDSGFSYVGNGHVLAELGINLTDRFAVSVYGGYAGLMKGDRVFPLLLRATAYHHEMTEDGLFCFAEAGPGFHSSTPHNTTLPAALMADAGCGYHVALSRSIGLDFQLSLRGAFDHTLIKDADTGEWIPDADVRRNETRAYALCLSIGLSF